jgi:hypothetical protein
MSNLDIAFRMDGIANAITAAGLATNVYPYPPESVTVPCVVVGYPTNIDLDITFDRGGDLLAIPVYFIVGTSNTKAARTALFEILSNSPNIKSVLDATTSFGAVRVTDASVEEVSVSGVDYIAAKFNTEVVV